MTEPTGLDLTEARAVAAAFGVALDQVRRDHLVSVLLAALDHAGFPELTFFGGTALARTHLPAGRLSEDVDLITTGERTATAARIQRALTAAVRRTHGRPTWAPELGRVRDVDPAVLRTDDGLAVRVQLLGDAGYPAWPTEVRDLEQRYSDVAPARLRVPTLEAFAAWKTVAWCDRGTPRDLYDLWLLVDLGAISPAAAGLFARYGPTAGPPKEWMFTNPPLDDQWHAQLAGQTRLTVTAGEALAVVRAAWQEACR